MNDGTPAHPTDAERPIGVFDSGVGGLSVLNALRRKLPHERYVYFADTRHAPYGERSDAYVIERTLAVAQYLNDLHRVKALVVACNTATAAAIHLLRAQYPGFPLIGVEPALKPAVAISRTHRIGVIGTRSTLSSHKFEALRASLAAQAQFSVVPCDGLAGAIEREDARRIRVLCARYMGATGPFGIEPGKIDTLVLGCTHYLFVADELRRHAPPAVRFIETGVPVAQQTHRLLAASGQLGLNGAGSVVLVSSGAPEALDAAAARWLSSGAVTARATLAATSGPAVVDAMPLTPQAA